MKNKYQKTVYILTANKPVIDRAAKLLAFYESKSFSEFMADKCREIVVKYDGEKAGSL